MYRCYTSLALLLLVLREKRWVQDGRIALQSDQFLFLENIAARSYRIYITEEQGRVLVFILFFSKIHRRTTTHHCIKIGKKRLI